MCLICRTIKFSDDLGAAMSRSFVTAKVMLISVLILL